MVEPTNTYREEAERERRIQGVIEQLKTVTRIRVHPDQEQHFRTLIESKAQLLPNLTRPGGIIVEPRLPAGKVLLERHKIEDEEAVDEELAAKQAELDAEDGR